jgi:DNA invertase Pin-like site-specific DNA recombinase/Txe/YoeB family toxin of Txe-Axe toxin-antitoxin module
MQAESSKVTADHLKRDAYLYVRQSTLHQVVENTESTKRQYDLRQRAVALGWRGERVQVIDQDLGQSAAGIAERAGFERLVAEVGMGRAGIVLGLEVSRLARSSMEWHRLLEICALTDTLILDEDGLYDPGHFNDRLLLGLKGTMSEAELHVLRARMLGGIRSKARRGELELPLPTGLIYDATGRIVRDPDERVRNAMTLFFDTFRRTGSATATVRHFRDQRLLFPVRPRSGPQQGEVIFRPLRHSQALKMLRSPRYAGAFAYGRTRSRRKPDGGVQTRQLPRQEWQVLLHDAHEGYLTWAQYEANLVRLRENAQAFGGDRRGPPREGSALLQGLVLCGRCGNRMRVRYHVRTDGTQVPSYICDAFRIHGGRTCQNLVGTTVDEAIGKLLIEAMTPLHLEVALAIDDELRSQAEALDRLRRQHVESARYEADLAERRYRRVDPDHRLVADTLEADWNHALRKLTEARETYEQQRHAEPGCLDASKRQEILALATDFPRLWRDPRTPQREKKRMVRLLIEDVTLIKSEAIIANVRFRGGATRTLTLPLPRSGRELLRTDPAITHRIDDLLDHHTDDEVAALLNQEGLRTGRGFPWSSRLVHEHRLRHGLKSRYQRLRDRGLWTASEMGAFLGISAAAVGKRLAAGRLQAYRCDGRNLCLYEPPTSSGPAPRKSRNRNGKKRTLIPATS